MIKSQQLYMCIANYFCGRNHDYGGEMISFVKQGLETSISIKKHQLNNKICGNELENEIEIQ
ncbi:hypothetical protein BpHYR1_053383 [Brachionus plicatilis]|uniref:Uncharacterized protein n=1 Tax=Brachionus plicatilis TaxID=10195 RepID=A0A3M7P3H5_BRAPC|nr:hypothetical protein BpHYR1_053383 [Brachionus plicatilis]